MTGTYELESTGGDDPRRAADAATRSLPPERRGRVYQNLLARLEPPQTLAIDRDGRLVTISSSNGPRVTVDADGRLRSEEGPYGRVVSTRADIVGDRLIVSTNGNRGNDFSVTFESLSNGNRLRVTRRLDSDELNRPVTAQSVYRRIAYEPRWELSENAPLYNPRDDGRRAEPFAVPEGTRLSATLDTLLSTRMSRGGDRFTMTVRSPRQFEGARIDGVVARVNRREQADNRADIMVNFETIQFRGGQTAAFRGFIDAVRTPDGATVRVDAENGVRDASETETRIEHGAIGAAVGAIIGAIAGGGKGAAVGAIVGGAGGAILADGHDELDLRPGTQVSITATRGY